ncbi:hypothetical protein GIB67_029808 [Kingdonia uniflora]|uniref:Uncharacterized protein n=1 Tax=Kingdonia uniflora TaxID=39325 RepID=A0A7J7NJI8_9MAGN|nr:hypothetical protein GIB67_029808 [Kingdonia uniflora]
MKVRYICIEAETFNCQWMFYARVNPDGTTFNMRKSSNLIHTYPGRSDQSNKNINAQWVVKKVEETIRTVRTTRLAGVKELISRRYGIDISYYTSWNAWTICMEKIVGSYDEGYILQPEFMRQVLLANPGSLAKCSKDLQSNQ